MRTIIFCSLLAVLNAGCAEPSVDQTNSLVDPGTAPAIPVAPILSQEVSQTPEKDTVVTDDTPQDQRPKSYNKLDDFERYVLLHKGTEPGGTGAYTDTDDPGVYICRQCNAQLYKSSHKFLSHCGWPAFDDEIDGAVTRKADQDGMRTEILCTNCDGHLGHVFVGEYLTKNNMRHCVNSVSMIFVPEGSQIPEKIVLDGK